MAHLAQMVGHLSLHKGHQQINSSPVPGSPKSLVFLPPHRSHRVQRKVMWEFLRHLIPAAYRKKEDKDHWIAQKHNTQRRVALQQSFPLRVLNPCEIHIQMLEGDSSNQPSFYLRTGWPSASAELPLQLPVVLEQ